MELLPWLSDQLDIEFLHRSTTYVDSITIIRTNQLSSCLSPVFGLPFFIINCLKLRQRQKIALVCVFSLGLITIAISLARFIVYTATNYTVDDASGSRLVPNLFSPASFRPRPFSYRVKHSSLTMP
jgi:hypothetical protein